MSADNSVPSAPIGQECVPFGAPRLGIAQRLLFLGVGIVLVTLLAIAAWLKPDPFQTGIGTHQQLGLPPCSAVQLFGIRCPACGMTTSWSHVMHGQVWRALRSNAGGTLLAVSAIFWGPWFVGSGLRGRFAWQPPPLEWIAAGAATIATVTLLEWGVRMWLR